MQAENRINLSILKDIHEWKKLGWTYPHILEEIKNDWGVTTETGMNLLSQYKMWEEEHTDIGEVI